MKNLTLLCLGLMTAFLVSCSGDDDTGNISTTPILVGFAQSSYDFAIPQDSSTVLSIEIQASSAVAQDRTFGLTLVDSTTSADPGSYTIPSSVTIPAGTNTAVITIQGNDNGMVPASPGAMIGLKLVNPDSNVTIAPDHPTTTLHQFLFCPVPADFLVGDYMLTCLPDSTGHLHQLRFSDGVVSLSVGNLPNERVFENAPFPEIHDIQDVASMTFTLNLSCGTIILEEKDTDWTCDVISSIYFGPAFNGQNGHYSVQDEQDSYLIDYTSDIYHSCGYFSYVLTFKLTKVD